MATDRFSKPGVEVVDGAANGGCNAPAAPPSIGGRKGLKLGAAGFSGSAGVSGTTTAAGTLTAVTTVCGGVT